jgi:hypothetical protein
MGERPSWREYPTVATTVTNGSGPGDVKLDAVRLRLERQPLVRAAVVTCASRATLQALFAHLHGHAAADPRVEHHVQVDLVSVSCDRAADRRRRCPAVRVAVTCSATSRARHRAVSRA